jgi:DnaJ-class molecular chaperone
MKEEHNSSCSYCEGDGYFQLITGGTETCPSCGGDGTSNLNFSALLRADRQ